MAIKDEKNNWIDPRGRTVPSVYVKPLDRKRDTLVEGLVNMGLKLEERMRRDKEKMLDRMDKYIGFAEKVAGAPKSGKGNVTLTNFSGNKQVEFKINDILQFDERIQMAKSIIDSCLHKWSEGSHKNIQVLVDQAFQVDKKGTINTKAILRLRTLNIRDKKWKEAMDLISDSIQITGSRNYLNIRVRNEDGKWRTINLNFSSI